PGLTWQSVSGVHRDTGFDGRIEGHVYAQPLYWHPSAAGTGLIIVATESDVVWALDAASGRVVWHTTLGRPVPRSALPCGNINPLGITGTPVIEPQTGALYLDAMVDQDGTPQHLIFGLRLADGSVLPGWPINVQQALHRFGIPFRAAQQNQRSALALLDGRIFVAFSGQFGDCGGYHGIVLGVGITPPQPAAAWATRGVKGGIWPPGGIVVADGSLFFTTGNTAHATTWADGEGVFRLGADLARTNNPRDFFAPANWKTLDDDDLDLSGVNPMAIDVPGPRGPAGRIVALGKDGKAYLLDRDDLGGIGGQIAVRQVAAIPIITAPAVVETPGRVTLVYPAPDAICPDGRRQTGLTALTVTATTLSPAWCAPLDGRGAPIVTTADGSGDPIVWVAGAEGDDRLHAFRGDTGQPLFTGAEAITGLRRFVTILVADHRLYIAGDGRISAFTWTAR
ncbi:MAG: hypothetical protein ACREF3_20750, partial [Acetobacteraceae bacterium]